MKEETKMDGCSLKLIQLSRKTLLEMLIDRGYIFDGCHNTLIHDTSKKIVGRKVENVITVFFLLQKRQVPLLKEFIAKNCSSNSKSEFEFDGENRSYITVVQFNVNKTFKTLCSQYGIEIFKIHSLGRNITKHSLVPKHVLLSQEKNPSEMDNILKDLSISHFEKLPIMKVSDPVAKYYGAKVGNIFRITRHSKTSGLYTSFRYLVEG